MLDLERTKAHTTTSRTWFFTGPWGRLGNAPSRELKEHGRISGACLDAALAIIPESKVRGTVYNTANGNCVGDYIDVINLVDALAKALGKAKLKKDGIIMLAWAKVRGTDYNTANGNCIGDYISVINLVDAPVKALGKAKLKKVGIIMLAWANFTNILPIYYWRHFGHEGAANVTL